MGEFTNIHYADSSNNVVMGCKGCELRSLLVNTCFAGQLIDMRAGNPGYPPSFEEIQCHSGRTAKAAAWGSLIGIRRPTKPWLNGYPRIIFVSDLGELFADCVSFSFIATEVLQVARSRLGQRHIWLAVTKRPQRLLDFWCWWHVITKRDWPANVWVGTSVTTQETALARVPPLLKVGGAETTRFISVEPQLETIDLKPWLPDLDWIIQGGESGQGARPFQLEWARSLYGQCKEACTPYFAKQLGAVVRDGDRDVMLRDRHGADWAEWRALRLDVPFIRDMPRSPGNIPEHQAPPRPTPPAT